MIYKLKVCGSDNFQLNRLSIKQLTFFKIGIMLISKNVNLL